MAPQGLRREREKGSALLALKNFSSMGEGLDEVDHNGEGS